MQASIATVYQHDEHTIVADGVSKVMVLGRGAYIFGNVAAESAATSDVVHQWWQERW